MRRSTIKTLRRFVVHLDKLKHDGFYMTPSIDQILSKSKLKRFYRERSKMWSITRKGLV